MDAILFSGDRNNVDDAVRHLADHKELYWEVAFPIKQNFRFPIYGFIHINGEQVEYRATIRDIVPFSPADYENGALKPEPWIREWKENINAKRSKRSGSWKNALVITEIVPFSYDTYSFIKTDGTKVRMPPQGFVRVVPPTHVPQLRPQPAPAEKKVNLAERNLEDFLIQQLEVIEPGLHLVARQLRTPDAGRLDLLCKDTNGNYVVIELKRMQGTDQVVGQILRYMGWVKETYRAEKVRGIIVVGKKDQALSYAAMAAPNIQVKEFKVLID